MKDEDINKLINNLNKLSFLLGQVHGKAHTLLTLPEQSMKNSVLELFHYLTGELNKIYYEDNKKD